MSISGQKILGVLAVAIGVVGLVGMGIHEVAISCDKSTTTAAVAPIHSATSAISSGAGEVETLSSARRSRPAITGSMGSLRRRRAGSVGDDSAGTRNAA